jgi:hypothetical protein
MRELPMAAVIFADAIAPAVIGLVGALIGGLMAAGASLIGDVLRRNHERQSRTEEREAELQRQQAAYQFDTLLELQLAAQRLSRACGKSQHLDAVNHRRTGEAYGSHLLPDEWDLEWQESSVAVSLLASRLQSEEVRSLVREIKKAATAVVLAKSEAEGERAVLDVGSRVEDLLNAVGELVRGLPPGSAYRPMITGALAEADLRRGRSAGGD